MVIFLTVMGMLMLATFLYGFVLLSETGALFFASLQGYKLIVVEDTEGKAWKSYVKIAPISGKMTAYRFPCTKIGIITLQPDGTGYYHSNILWRPL